MRFMIMCCCNKKENKTNQIHVCSRNKCEKSSHILTSTLQWGYHVWVSHHVHGYPSLWLSTWSFEHAHIPQSSNGMLWKVHWWQSVCMFVGENPDIIFLIYGLTLFSFQLKANHTIIVIISHTDIFFKICIHIL